VKQFFQKISSIVMTLLVLFSTVSFTVDKHYCGDMLMDMAVLHKAEACAMEKAFSKTCSVNIEKSSCCSDKQIVIDGQDDLKITWDTITLEDQQFLVAYTLSYVALYTDDTSQPLPTDDYAPPLIVRDILVLHDTYLI